MVLLRRAHGITLAKKAANVAKPPALAAKQATPFKFPSFGGAPANAPSPQPVAKKAAKPPAAKQAALFKFPSFGGARIDNDLVHSLSPS